MSVELAYHEFPVLHADFYGCYEKWRRSAASTSVVQDGIYYLLAGKPIPRCLQEDPDGILYIGKGKILQEYHRLGKLINSLNATDKMHEAGVRYNQRKLNTKYPIRDIKLRVILCASPRKSEAEALAKYVREFGELPPLNHCS
jgi:hypothetical protein